MRYMRASSVYEGARYSPRWAEEYKLPLFHTSIAHLNNRPVFATFPTLIALRLFLPIISFPFFSRFWRDYIRQVGRWVENYKLGLFHASIAPSDPTLIPWFRFSSFGTILTFKFFWHSTSQYNFNSAKCQFDAPSKLSPSNKYLRQVEKGERKMGRWCRRALSLQRIATQQIANSSTFFYSTKIFKLGIQVFV